MADVKFKHASAETSTGFLFWQASTLWQRAIVTALTPYDLTHAQFVLLASIGWLSKTQTKPISQVMLAEHAKTDIMMTSKVVRTLIEKKLITRTDHPTDSRAYALRLTAQGIGKLQVTLDAVEAIDETFFEVLKGPVSFRNELLNLIKRHSKE